jgi:hypothetical protein
LKGAGMTAEDYQVHKLFAIAQIASSLLIRSKNSKAAIRTATEIVNLAERELIGPAKEKPKEGTVPERLHLIRLVEKLRAGTLDSEERLELAELVEADYA